MLRLELIDISKQYPAVKANDRIRLRVEPGEIHAVLGENGAGKSTLMKIIYGAVRPDEGEMVWDGRQVEIRNPQEARALGIAMVFQHFSLFDTLTAAENVWLGLDKSWTLADVTRRIVEVAGVYGLDVDPLRPVHTLSVGERQRVEIVRALLTRPRLLILDEPTSVLTPQEADEVLAFVRAVARRGECTVLMITHKFREVMAYADEVTVLRRGRKVHGARVDATTPAQLAQAMMGEAATANESAEGKIAAEAGTPVARAAVAANAAAALEVDALSSMGDRGTLAVRSVSLAVRAGEILGIAGVSGNGQRELVEAIVGQRARAGGTVRVAGQPYAGKRSENRRLQLRALTEEPLKSASVGEFSVAHNMALRDFDQPPLQGGSIPGLTWLRFGVWRERARAWIAEYGIKTRSETAPISSLSGGNVQRAVLARELAGNINVLIAANPVFGLDFAAVAEIHARIVQVRAKGGAVLLVSEDLDELLELSDRIAVMSEGQIVYETRAAGADRHTIGAHMGGHAEAA